MAGRCGRRLIAVGCPRVDCGAQSLSLIDLGAGVSAYGINASGQVYGLRTGWSWGNARLRYSAGVMTDLGTLGGAGSCGYAINAGGQVTGYCGHRGRIARFSLRRRTMTDLGTVGGVPTSAGVSINAGGDVAGYAWPYTPFATASATRALRRGSESGRLPAGHAHCSRVPL